MHAVPIRPSVLLQFAAAVLLVARRTRLCATLLVSLSPRLLVFLSSLLLVSPSSARADIFQWEYINPNDPSQGKRQSTTLVPDGAGVDVVPGANLSNRDLTMAYLSGAFLSGFRNAGVPNCQCIDVFTANLSNANLTSADLTRASLTIANLAGANFTDADIREASFGKYSDYGGTGITLAQLYSTASYKMHDLSGINLEYNNLAGANLVGQNLTNSNFGGAYANGSTAYAATLAHADLTNADLRSANFFGADLTNANFTGAKIQGANFASIGDFYGLRGGITLTQLSSTASYQARDLSSVNLFGNNFTGGNFSGQNLTGTSFKHTTLTGADFTGAEIRGTSFAVDPLMGTGGITLAQLYSTASYRSRDVSGIDFGFNNLAGGNFADQKLTSAYFYGATLTSADFREAKLTDVTFDGAKLNGANFHEANLANTRFFLANLTGADFRQANLENAQFGSATLTNADFTASEVRGANFQKEANGTAITLAQLYSTASYLNGDLSSVNLSGNNLVGGNFVGQNLTNVEFGQVNLTDGDLSDADLTNARFSGATLTGADFTGAQVHGTGFTASGTGLTTAQLYSTASYQAHDLAGIRLSGNLSGWNFVGQNLSSAALSQAALTGADFTGAQVKGADFTASDLTAAQLYSTASYQAHDLAGIRFISNNLSGWNFARQNLTNSSFGISIPNFGNFYANLTDADFTGADTRGAQYVNLSGAITTNLIHPDGHIYGLNLTAGEKLVAYPGVPIPVHVSDGFSIAPNATFDLTDNDLIVRATADTKDAIHADVQAKIVTAQNGVDANGLTNWNGPGITSSSARATNAAAGRDIVGLGVIRNSDLDITTGIPGSSYTTFSGLSVTPDHVLVKYTYIGDGNLDGVVSFDDYAAMDAAFFGLIPNLGWATGDINLDGVINFDDYCVVDQAFFFQGAPLTSDGAGAVAVPEPATVFLIAIGLLSIVAIMSRHRRPCSVHTTT